MADDLLGQLLAFSFASWTFAYNCLAQGLNKSVTGFSSFVKHYFDPCLAASVCTQFVDVIPAGVNNFDEMFPALRKIFDCLREAGLKGSVHKCEFGTTKIDYLRRTITTKGISPEKAKIESFWGQVRMPITVKQVKRLFSYRNGYRNKDVNLVIESRAHPKFCISDSNLLTATTCIALFFSDFAMGKGLPSTLACCYSELQEMRKVSLKLFPPGSLVAYFDQQNNRHLYILVRKRRFFHRPTYGKLELGLQPLKQQLKCRNFQELAIPKLGCGYDQLHWPTVFDFIRSFIRFKLYHYNISAYTIT